MRRTGAICLAAALGTSLVACKKKPEPPDGGKKVVMPIRPPSGGDAGAPIAPPSLRTASWREGLKSADPKARAEACRSILPADLSAPPVELVAALGDPDSLVRRAAIKGVLGFILQYSDASALLPLLGLAENDADTHVRAEAVRAVGSLSHRDVVPGLVKILGKEKNPSIREEVFAIFSREGDHRAVPVLLTILKENEPSQLVFEALRRIGDPAAISALVPLLDHASPATRANAITALADVSDASVAPKLVKALLDKEVSVVRAAIKAVANIGSPAAVPSLLQLVDHTDPRVRLRAIRALATYRNPDAIPAADAFARVVKHLQSDDERIRVESARVFGVVGLKRAVPALKEAAGNKNPRPVRMAALEALGVIGDASALPVLVEAVGSKDPDVRESAARGLGAMGPPAKSAAATLRDALKKGETDIDTRMEMVRALGPLGDDSLAGMLKEIGEKDPVPLVRVEAGGALLRLGKTEGAAVLRPVLTGGTDWQERRAAARAIDVHSTVAAATELIAEALGTEKEPLVREELYRKLGDAKGPVAAGAQRKFLAEKVPFFRLMAADGLCENGGPEGCEVLVKALEEAEATVRTEAARRLGVLKVKDARAALQKALGDPVVWVAKAAKQALEQLDQK